MSKDKNGHVRLQIKVDEQQIRTEGMLNIVDEALGEGKRGDVRITVPVQLLPNLTPKIEVLELQVAGQKLPALQPIPLFVRQPQHLTLRFIVPHDIAVGVRTGKIWAFYNRLECLSSPFDVDFTAFAGEAPKPRTRRPSHVPKMRTLTTISHGESTLKIHIPIDYRIELRACDEGLVVAVDFVCASRGSSSSLPLCSHDYDSGWILQSICKPPNFLERLIGETFGSKLARTVDRVDRKAARRCKQGCEVVRAYVERMIK